MRCCVPEEGEGEREGNGGEVELINYSPVAGSNTILAGVGGKGQVASESSGM